MGKTRAVRRDARKTARAVSSDAIRARQRGELAIAKAGFKAALQRNPNDHAASHALADIAHLSGHHDELLRLLPGLAEANAKYDCNLGTTLNLLSRCEEAGA